MPDPALLFVGILWTDETARADAVTRLTAQYGGVVSATPDETFLWPEYYKPEMGDGIMRKYMFLDKLLPRDELADVKIVTNALEDNLRKKSGREGRPVNIDPGYLSLENLVLATTKARPHRICLRDGIYAESTLGYVNGAYRPWPWTYPDYARPILQPFFSLARKALKRMLG
jgi:hypothetical protein